MVDQIESAVSLSTFNFLFPDAGENFETVEPVKMALPELPTMDIENEYLAFCDSHSSTESLRKHLHLDPALQPSHRPLNLDDGSYYEMQHLKAQYQNLEKHLDCLSQTLQSVQDEVKATRSRLWNLEGCLKQFVHWAFAMQAAVTNNTDKLMEQINSLRWERNFL